MIRVILEIDGATDHGPLATLPNGEELGQSALCSRGGVDVEDVLRGDLEDCGYDLLGFWYEGQDPVIEIEEL